MKCYFLIALILAWVVEMAKDKPTVLVGTPITDSQLEVKVVFEGGGTSNPTSCGISILPAASSTTYTIKKSIVRSDSIATILGFVVDGLTQTTNYLVSIDCPSMNPTVIWQGQIATGAKPNSNLKDYIVSPFSVLMVSSFGGLLASEGRASVEDAYGKFVKCVNESLSSGPAVLLPKATFVLGGMDKPDVGKSTVRSVDRLWLDTISSQMGDLFSRYPIKYVPSPALDANPGTSALVDSTNLRQLYRQVFPSLTSGAPDNGLYHAFTINSVRFIVLDTVSNLGDTERMLDAKQMEWLQGELKLWNIYLVTVIVTSNPWSGVQSGWTRDSSSSKRCCSQERVNIANMIKDIGVGNLVMITGGSLMGADGGNGTDYADGRGAGFPVFTTGPVNDVSQPSDGLYDQGCFGYTNSKTSAFSTFIVNSEKRNGGNVINVCIYFVGYRVPSTVPVIRSQKCRTIIVDTKVLEDKTFTPLYPVSWLAQGDPLAKPCNLATFPAHIIAAIAFSATLGISLLLAVVLYFTYRRFKRYKRRLEIAGNMQRNRATDAQQGSQMNLMMVGENVTEDKLAELAGPSVSEKPTTVSNSRNRRNSSMHERDAAEIHIQSQEDSQQQQQQQQNQQLPPISSRSRSASQNKDVVPENLRSAALPPKIIIPKQVPEPTRGMVKSSSFQVANSSKPPASNLVKSESNRSLQSIESSKNPVSNLVKSESNRSLRSLRSGSSENLIIRKTKLRQNQK